MTGLIAVADMGTLFLHIGVFAAITAVVAAVCFWFVAQDEKKSRK